MTVNTMHPYIALFLAFGCGFSLLVIIAAIVAIKDGLPLFGMPAPKAPPPPTILISPAPRRREMLSCTRSGEAP